MYLKTTLCVFPSDNEGLRRTSRCNFCFFLFFFVISIGAGTGANKNSANECCKRTSVRWGNRLIGSAVSGFDKGPRKAVTCRTWSTCGVRFPSNVACDNAQYHVFISRRPVGREKKVKTTMLLQHFGVHFCFFPIHLLRRSENWTRPLLHVNCCVWFCFFFYFFVFFFFLHKPFALRMFMEDEIYIILSPEINFFKAAALFWLKCVPSVEIIAGEKEMNKKPRDVRRCNFSVMFLNLFNFSLFFCLLLFISAASFCCYNCDY